MTLKRFKITIFRPRLKMINYQRVYYALCIKHKRMHANRLTLYKKLNYWKQKEHQRLQRCRNHYDDYDFMSFWSKILVEFA